MVARRRLRRHVRQRARLDARFRAVAPPVDDLLLGVPGPVVVGPGIRGLLLLLLLASVVAVGAAGHAVQLVAPSGHAFGPGHAPPLVDEPLEERVHHRQVGQDDADEGLADGPVAGLRRVGVAELE